MSCLHKVADNDPRITAVRGVFSRELKRFNVASVPRESRVNTLLGLRSAGISSNNIATLSRIVRASWFLMRILKN